MASFAPIRGTKDEVEATPRIDGQFLIETDQGNQNKIWVDTEIDGVVERSMAGGGGHQILPDPDPNFPEPTEAGVVAAVNAAEPRSDKISSLFGTQKWSNELTKRFIVVGSANNSVIGKTGIGTWYDNATITQVTPTGNENPQSRGWYEIDNTTHNYIATTDTTVVVNKKYFSRVIDESTWLHLDILSQIDTSNSNDIKVSLCFDPSTNEAIVLRGYMIDTDTGNICIGFANAISDTQHAKVSIDITYTRNEYSVIN